MEKVARARILTRMLIVCSTTCVALLPSMTHARADILPLPLPSVLPTSTPTALPSTDVVPSILPTTLPSVLPSSSLDLGGVTGIIGGTPTGTPGDGGSTPPPGGGGGTQPPGGGGSTPPPGGGGSGGGGGTGGGGAGPGGAGDPSVLDGSGAVGALSRGSLAYGNAAGHGAIVAAGRALRFAGPLAPPIALAIVLLILVAMWARGSDRLVKIERDGTRRSYRL